MNLLPVCVLYTQDAAVVTRFKGYLYSLAVVRHVEQASRLETVLHQFDPAVLFLDLRGTQARVMLPRLQHEFPDSIVIGLGVPRSDPAIEAEAQGVYSVEPLDLDRPRLQSLLKRSQERIRLVNENRMLKQGHRGVPDRRPADAERVRGPLGALPWHHFSRAFRNFENLAAMLESVAEGVASCAKVSRVGIFYARHEGDPFRLGAAVKCLEDARALEVPEEAPLVRWMRINAHLISRSMLEHVDDTAERLLLEQCLDTLGAEVIAPLYGQSRLLGWVFLGHRITGVPFTAIDLEELVVLAEHVSTTLENALLHEEITVQKTLAETVLHCVPVGIVAVGDDGTVRWFNRAAEAMLDASAEDMRYHRGTGHAARIAALLAQCMSAGPLTEPVEWVDAASGRDLQVMTRRLENGAKCLGAVAIIIDMTHEKQLRDKQHEIERAAFWAELAAAMSHAVRNPLVAISTFAQLLPERYEDQEFRSRFSELVSCEIQRLNGMVDQLSSFAHPPPLEFEPVRIEPVLERAIETVRERLASEQAAGIEFSAGDALPYIEGDRNALAECFAHLITNAVEAVGTSKYPTIHVTAGVADGPSGRRCVVNVQDNGKGVPPDVLENIYSPLCTMKVRGIGLGLPIVRRTVEDHHGTITIDTGSRGTNVTVSFPVLSSSPAGDRSDRMTSLAGTTML